MDVLDHCGLSGSSEDSDSVYILKLEPTKFDDGLVVMVI